MKTKIIKIVFAVAMLALGVFAGNILYDYTHTKNVETVIN
jgi:hypothetical protein